MPIWVKKEKTVTSSMLKYDSLINVGHWSRSNLGTHSYLSNYSQKYIDIIIIKLFTH